MQRRFGGVKFVQKDVVKICEPLAIIEVVEVESEGERHLHLVVDIYLCHGWLETAVPLIL